MRKAPIYPEGKSREKLRWFLGRIRALSKGTYSKGEMQLINYIEKIKDGVILCKKSPCGKRQI